MPPVVASIVATSSLTAPNEVPFLLTSRSDKDSTDVPCSDPTTSSTLSGEELFNSPTSGNSVHATFS